MAGRGASAALRGLPVAPTTACAANRVQQGFVEVLVDGLPQGADEHVDDVGLRIEMIVPYAFEQHGARHHLPAVAHHEFEQLKFARREFDFLAVAHHPARHAIDDRQIDGH